ncbi:hypothetical protein H8356DRAFT_1430765 [Neocallimastix lanati (nom. inval.)]|nr:hypothetical protein H8356DRAFT_1430765 [Neocallimastix sp. JGI-2020a]
MDKINNSEENKINDNIICRKRENNEEINIENIKKSKYFELKKSIKGQNIIENLKDINLYNGKINETEDFAKKLHIEAPLDPRGKAEPTIEELDTVIPLRQGLRNGILIVGKNPEDLIFVGVEPETFAMISQRLNNPG